MRILPTTTPGSRSRKTCSALIFHRGEADDDLDDDVVPPRPSVEQPPVAQQTEDDFEAEAGFPEDDESEADDEGDLSFDDDESEFDDGEDGLDEDDDSDSGEDDEAFEEEAGFPEDDELEAGFPDEEVEPPRRATSVPRPSHPVRDSEPTRGSSGFDRGGRESRPPETPRRGPSGRTVGPELHASGERHGAGNKPESALNQPHGRPPSRSVSPLDRIETPASAPPSKPSRSDDDYWNALNDWDSSAPAPRRSESAAGEHESAESHGSESRGGGSRRGGRPRREERSRRPEPEDGFGPAPVEMDKPRSRPESSVARRAEPRLEEPAAEAPPADEDSESGRVRRRRRRGRRRPEGGETSGEVVEQEPLAGRSETVPSRPVSEDDFVDEPEDPAAATGEDDGFGVGLDEPRRRRPRRGSSAHTPREEGVRFEPVAESPPPRPAVTARGPEAGEEELDETGRPRRRRRRGRGRGGERLEPAAQMTPPREDVASETSEDEFDLEAGFPEDGDGDNSPRPSARGRTDRPAERAAAAPTTAAAHFEQDVPTWEQAIALLLNRRSKADAGTTPSASSPSGRGGSGGPRRRR